MQERREFFSDLKSKSLQKFATTLENQIPFVNKLFQSKNNPQSLASKNSKWEIELLRTHNPINVQGEPFGSNVGAFAVFDSPSISEKKKLLVMSHFQATEIKEGLIDSEKRKKMHQQSTGLSIVELILDEKLPPRLNNPSLLNRRIHSQSRGLQLDQILCMTATLWNTVLLINYNRSTQERKLLEFDPFRVSVTEYDSIDVSKVAFIELKLNSQNQFELFLNKTHQYTTSDYFHPKRVDLNRNILKTLSKIKNANHIPSLIDPIEKLHSPKQLELTHENNMYLIFNDHRGSVFLIRSLT